MGHATSMSPVVIAIVGHSGAGKTTLIERLLPLLIANGMRVATIKHSHHTPELDVAGTDSWRHKKAGASASMLVTPSGMQLVTDSMTGQGPVQLAQRYFSNMDLVLAEGFSLTDCPKIEVLRKACNPVARCLPEQGLMALVSDMECSDPQLRYFKLSDIDGIAQYVIDAHQLQGTTA